MKYLWLSSILFLTGCDQVTTYFTPSDSFVAPCYVEEVREVNGEAKLYSTNVRGFKHVGVTTTKQQRLTSHCLPCERANSRDEKHTCNGDKE